MTRMTPEAVGDRHIREADAVRKQQDNVQPWMDDQHLMAGLYGYLSVEEEQLAARLCRRMTYRHPCAQHCRHRNHRRDVSYCQLMLDILGLQQDA